MFTVFLSATFSVGLTHGERFRPDVSVVEEDLSEVAGSRTLHSDVRMSTSRSLPGLKASCLIVDSVDLMRRGSTRAAVGNSHHFVAWGY
jgi:hypothetical protein